MIWLYDIEVYLNYFAVIFKNPKSQELKEFIIFEDRNDLDKLKEFISDKHKWFVGYNSFYFDNQLLNYIYVKYQELTLLSTKEITGNIYYLAKLIIESDYNTYKYNLPFRSLDLMKIGGIMKSLKLVAVSLKWSLIQDLPLSWDTIITKDHLELMHKYNLNDVLITEQLYYKLKEEIKKIMFQIPNIIHESVPIGKDDSENVEIKKIGKPKSFKFPVKSHVELGESLDILDFDTSAETSGKGFYYLKGDLALLNMALINFARDQMIKHG